jgi:hypothetical protein
MRLHEAAASSLVLKVVFVEQMIHLDLRPGQRGAE